MLVTAETIDQLAWDKAESGLLPLIVQNAYSGKILMQGFVNQAALIKTFETGFVTFFSRSKQRLWTKGETSNHTLDLVELSTDCDSDSLIALAKPNGPTCHLGNETCWDEEGQPQLAFLSDLEQVIASRKGAEPESSYTARLYAKGVKRIAQKVGEEGVECALAATAGDKEELICESADLLYHLTVLLQSMDLEMNDVINKLKERHK
ncbi:phosphoribosyl-ATP pyrophosphatase/phosphoribosyl-AMP cyclohydrolase [Catenovulum agarivorans DS-2]|uniref:Histidine biosynthesis bifunctional protein HisIE n=1 Tax=Catenovulum agarivorans DS-2 TaxID=1328313 RepID=W7QL03_9ALTE|nr:bifunctional phosphoribosyl-AMP cyclohydrolase/phosphoribosyl-ATP diphosphatase HisIE [Catenovulum agarivorans]EWH09617.1 phosphoribosyl-ATP pyrophosphatase/phosphoribosyl-AMP cyclohydrolase [Catenovulum agarivorans DS-2]